MVSLQEDKSVKTQLEHKTIIKTRKYDCVLLIYNSKALS